LFENIQTRLQVSIPRLLRACKLERATACELPDAANVRALRHT